MLQADTAEASSEGWAATGQGPALLVNPCHQHLLLSMIVVLHTDTSVSGLGEAVLHGDSKTLFARPIIMDVPH